MDFAQLLIIAILVEATWENIKMVYQKNKISISMIGSLLIAILFCTLTRVDIFPIVGLPISIPIVGSIFTGVIVSRGANIISDIFSKIKEIKK